jgi:hypothetical protein
VPLEEGNELWETLLEMLTKFLVILTPDVIADDNSVKSLALYAKAGEESIVGLNKSIRYSVITKG